MAHPAETRAHVRRLYIEGLPLSGAATAVKVSYETAREWKRQSAQKGDDWDTARAAYKVSEQGIDALNKQLVEDFSRQVITTTRELETARIEAVGKARLLSQLADAYAKFSRAFSRINPAYSGLSVALDTLKTLADYLAENDKAALKILQEHLDAVGALLSRRYA